jgi:chemotaxis response regulator CheB
MAASPSRIYIVYHDGLFAQGMRSLLESGQSTEIVGMESDVAKALEALRTLKPEVLIVEEPAATDRPSGLVATFLKEGVASRIVSLSLGRDYATIYESHRLPARNVAEFDQAIRGGRREG